MNSITFNGVSSESLGIFVEHAPVRKYPERNYETTHVPGRMGDLIVDPGSYNNVERTYDISMGVSSGRTHDQLIDILSKWLHSGSGYCELTDTFEPDRLRFAYYSEESSVSAYTQKSGASIMRATIRFICKPQIYFKEPYHNSVTRLSPSVVTTVTTPIQTGSPYYAEPMIKFRITSGVAGYYDIYNREPPYERYRISWSSSVTSPLLPSNDPDRVVVNCERKDIYSEYGKENLNKKFIVTKFIPAAEQLSYPYAANLAGTVTYSFPKLPPRFNCYASGLNDEGFEFCTRAWIL